MGWVPLPLFLRAARAAAAQGRLLGAGDPGGTCTLQTVRAVTHTRVSVPTPGRI